MNVTRYRAGDRRYVVVDAERYVPDRGAFAARVCDPETGVAPPDESPPVHVDQGISPPDDGDAVTATDGGAAEVDQADAGAFDSRGGDDRGADGVSASATSGGSSARAERGADGVLFLALEPAFNPPRVVMTVVHPDGERTPCCMAGARCAARWAARRADGDRVMVDTQAGTREARVHADGSVSVETADPDRTERGPVVREFAAEVPEPAR